MTLPTWKELQLKISQLERSIENVIDGKIQDIQTYHPIVHRAIKTTINTILPFPLNIIAGAIYDSPASPNNSEIQRISELKEYLKLLQTSGEENYKKISSQLNNIEDAIFNSKTVAAKESTVMLLKDTLVSKQDTLLEEVKNLKDQLRQTHIEIGDTKGDVIGVGVSGSGNVIVKELTLLINEVKEDYGLMLIETSYFVENSRTEDNFSNWQNGSEFTLPSIYYGREYRRNKVLEEIKERLETQGRLLLLGESGTSKSTLLMEMVCDYCDIGYKIFYGDGTQEPSKVNGLINTIKGLANAGNNILVMYYKGSSIRITENEILLDNTEVAVDLKGTVLKNYDAGIIAETLS